MANITLRDSQLEETEKGEVQPSMRPVALAAGYIDPVPRELVRSKRKQVIVVLTAGRQLLCFDHNLKELWVQRHVLGWYPEHSRFTSLSLLVTNHTMREGDRGTVLVAASVAEGEERDEEQDDRGETAVFRWPSADGSPALLGHIIHWGGPPNTHTLVRCRCIRARVGP